MIAFIIGILGLLFAVPRTRKWILSKVKFLGKDTQEGAKVNICRIKKGIYHLAEIYNAGPEDITDLVVKLYYKRSGIDNLSEEEIRRFINDNENPTFARPSDCKIIRAKEKKLITDFPFRNLEGKIKVNIKGKTMLSGKFINQDVEI